MNKRGMMQHQFLYMFYILFALLIFVLLVNTISDMYSGKGFNKQYLVRDTGMLIESAYIANGDLDIDYNLGGEYSIKIQDGILLLRENMQSSYGSYLIAEDEEDLEFDLTTENLKISNKKGVKVE